MNASIVLMPLVSGARRPPSMAGLSQPCKEAHMRPVPLARRLPARLALLGLLLFAIPFIAQASHPSPLPDDITTPNQNYHVHFTNDTPSPPGTDTELHADRRRRRTWRMRSTTRERPRPATRTGTTPATSTSGFGAPDFNGAERQVQVFDCVAARRLRLGQRAGRPHQYARHGLQDGLGGVHPAGAGTRAVPPRAVQLHHLQQVVASGAGCRSRAPPA